MLYIAETAVGLGDVDVIAHALREKQLLLTEDKDLAILFSGSAWSPVLC